jgi:hypothetical protein
MKSRSDDERILLKVMEPVEAELCIVTASGRRPPTTAELNALDLVSRNDLKRRQKEMLAALGDDDEKEPLSSLRYFCEYLTTYTHEPPVEAIEGMRKLLWPNGGNS